MGYRDDSPFRKEDYLDIYTPNGIIDMSNTGIPLLANGGRYLPPYSGLHQFDTPWVREIPLAQKGINWNPRFKRSAYQPSSEQKRLEAILMAEEERVAGLTNPERLQTLMEETTKKNPEDWILKKRYDKHRLEDLYSCAITGTCLARDVFKFTNLEGAPIDLTAGTSTVGNPDWHQQQGYKLLPIGSEERPGDIWNRATRMDSKGNRSVQGHFQTIYDPDTNRVAHNPGDIEAGLEFAEAQDEGSGNKRSRLYRYVGNSPQLEKDLYDYEKSHLTKMPQFKFTGFESSPDKRLMQMYGERLPQDLLSKNLLAKHQTKGVHKATDRIALPHHNFNENQYKAYLSNQAPKKSSEDVFDFGQTSSASESTDVTTPMFYKEDAFRDQMIAESEEKEKELQKKFDEENQNWRTEVKNEGAIPNVNPSAIGGRNIPVYNGLGEIDTWKYENELTEQDILNNEYQAASKGVGSMLGHNIKEYATKVFPDAVMNTAQFLTPDWSAAGTLANQYKGSKYAEQYGTRLNPFGHEAATLTTEFGLPIPLLGSAGNVAKGVAKGLNKTAGLVPEVGRYASDVAKNYLHNQPIAYTNFANNTFTKMDLSKLLQRSQLSRKAKLYDDILKGATATTIGAGVDSDIDRRYGGLVKADKGLEVKPQKKTYADMGWFSEESGWDEKARKKYGSRPFLEGDTWATDWGDKGKVKVSTKGGHGASVLSNLPQDFDVTKAPKNMRGAYHMAIAAGASSDAEARVIAAQWALESSQGKSKSATEHYNYFGIKGDDFQMSTNEVRNGKYTTENAGWEGYESPLAGFKARIEVTKNPKGRYHKAGYGADKSDLELANALSKAGYAMSGTYAANLKRAMAKLDYNADPVAYSSAPQNNPFDLDAFTNKVSELDNLFKQGTVNETDPSVQNALTEMWKNAGYDSESSMFKNKETGEYDPSKIHSNSWSGATINELTKSLFGEGQWDVSHARAMKKMYSGESAYDKPFNLESSNTEFEVGDVLGRGRKDWKDWKVEDFEKSFAKGEKGHLSHFDIIVGKGKDSKGSSI